MTDHQATQTESLHPLIPLILAGPFLRHVEPKRAVLCLVGSTRLSIRLRLSVRDSNEPLFDRVLTDRELHTLPLGRHAVFHLIDVSLEQPLPGDVFIHYDLGVATPHRPDECWIADWGPHLLYPGEACPAFVLKNRVDLLFHGSCRRPHHPAPDGFARIDKELRDSGDDPAARPALLLLTGDQIYADDVAGPMLRAIHDLIECLGLHHEMLEGATVDDSQALFEATDTYYGRERLLPATKRNQALLERFFGGVEKPIFTTSYAHNHLITLGEVVAMYLLVWSPVCWSLIRDQAPALDQERAEYYRREQGLLERFRQDLPATARAMAHLPCYMIFDDHDITDDWNLSGLWENTAYEHPFSRRIVGNALIAYLLFQGLGNKPSAFEDILPKLGDLLASAGEHGFLDPNRQDAMIDELLRFQGWHYTLPTRPKIVVLDTRTRRWRSEIAHSRPSGLMDWEALSEFQQEVMHHKSVIVVSPAPMFGVKLIEVIQRVFTFFGYPLLVDAENWMAHRGTANVLLNIFGHSGTPENFVILSGDVHYSFAYDVRLRHKANSPRIWQITSSGIKSQFPEYLLEWLDRLNRWLYAPRSPLNWFTKRRRMYIAPRLPSGREAGERLWNRAGIGLVALDEEGVPTDIRQLGADGGGTQFQRDPEAQPDRK